MDFNIRSIDGEESDLEYANKFVTELTSAITSKKQSLPTGQMSAPHLAMEAVVHLWGMLTSVETASYVVQNDPDYADGGYELMQHVFFEDFSAVMEDPSLITTEDIRMTNPRNCAMSFLRILAVQLLNFTPNATEPIEKQLVRQTANIFNGQNRFGICFELIAYKGETDEGHEFTGNLSPFILV